MAILLVAANAHAAWNLASKYKRSDTVLFVGAYTGVSAVLCLPFAVGAAMTGAQTVTGPLVEAAAVSSLLHLAYSLTLQAGYDRAALGIVYPVARGTGPLLTMVVAVLVLAERPSLLAVAGALAVLAGILVVTGNPFRSRSVHPFRGVLWGAATGATITGYTLWDAYAIDQLHLAPVSYYAGTLLVQSLLLAPSVVRRRAELRGTVRVDLAPILTVAVLSPLAYILVLTAMRTAPVSLVAPLRESSIIVGSLLAWWLFHEKDLARRLGGAAVVLAGIVAISL
ncbi:EamA family transporter [Streptomyces sp. NPDC001255]|uniref:EamA family transporter n=1 Tax=Streptomyces sp. NPDC001255 TaxID=3364550 RepID=UPI0036A182F4